MTTAGCTQYVIQQLYSSLQIVCPLRLIIPEDSPRKNRFPVFPKDSIRNGFTASISLFIHCEHLLRWSFLGVLVFDGQHLQKLLMWNHSLGSPLPSRPLSRTAPALPWKPSPIRSSSLPGASPIIIIFFEPFVGDTGLVHSETNSQFEQEWRPSRKNGSPPPPLFSRNLSPDFSILPASRSLPNHAD